MNDDQLLIKIEADASGFTKELKALKAEGKKLTDQFKKIKIGSTDKALANVKKLAAKQKSADISVYRAKTDQDRRAHKAAIHRIDVLAKKRIEANNRVKASVGNAVKKETGNNHSIGRALKTTALYGAAAQALYGLQNALKATGREAIQFNNYMYQNKSVLQATTKQNKILLKTVKDLGARYGGSFSEIQDGLITLGRAGVEAGEGLSTATKVIREMALITGDTMTEGADVMSSFINVFNDKSAEGVQKLGDKMMYVANATRLSLKDFSTFSNYALVTAQSMGLTENATLSLAGAFSKVGLNASTIGTSIARLGKILMQETAATKNFFREIGINQKNLMANIQKGGKEGEKALEGLLTQLSRLKKENPDRFNASIAKMPELMKRTIVSMSAAGGEVGYFSTMLKEMNGELKSTGEQADKFAKGFTPTMQRLKNTFLSSVQEGLKPYIEELGRLVQGFLDSNDAAETFKGYIDKATEAIKVILSLSASAWAVKMVTSIVSVAGAFLKLEKSAKLAKLSMGGMAALASLPAAAATVIGGMVIHDQMRDKGLGADAVKRAKEIEDSKALSEAYKTLTTDINATEAALNRVGGNSAAGEVLTENLKKQKGYLEDFYTSYSNIADKAEKATKNAGKPLEALKYEFSAKERLMQMELTLNKKVLAGVLTKREVEHALIDAQILAAQDYATKMETAHHKEGEALKANNALIDLQLRKKRMLLADSERGAGGSGGSGGGGGSTAQDVDLLRVKAEITKELERIKAEGDVRATTRYQQNKKDIKIAQKEYDIEVEVYNLRKKQLVKGDNNKSKRKMLTAELKMHRSKRKLTKEINKDAKRTAKELKAIGSTLFDDLASGNFKSALESMATSVRDILLTPLREKFATLFSNNFSEMISGATKTIGQALSSITKKTVAEGDIIGKANVKNSVSTSGALGGPPMVLAMLALLASVGMSAGHSGGGVGTSAGSMPSFQQVSGRQGEDRAANMNGVTLSLQEYNDVVTIAKENGMSFNKSLEAYNDLMAHATVVWREASTSLRKWGIEIGNYQTAVDAMHASGGFDEINEFFDNAASTGEQMAYLTADLAALSMEAGSNLPYSVESAKAAIQELMDAFYATADAAQQAKLLTQATAIAKAGNAAVKVAKAQKSAAAAAKAAAEEAKRAAEAWARTLVDIANLRAEWIGGVKGAKVAMTAAEKHTGLSGLTMDNFLERFTAASAGGLESDEFDKWSEMSQALRSLDDAIKQEQAEAINKLTEELDHLSDVFSRITDAWTGSLSYLTNMEKIGYLENIAKEQASAGGTSYLDTLAEQLMYEKQMSVTREDYMPKFDAYVAALGASEPEKTMDDAVETLEQIGEKIDDMKDAITAASYQS